MSEEKIIQNIEDNELGEVNGGAKTHSVRVACRKCKRPFYVDLNKSEAKCPYCGEKHTFAG